MRRKRPVSDAELLSATAVDAEAFADFYRRHESLVVGYLMRRVRDAELAADLTAEVFAAVLEAASEYRPVGPSAAPWVLTIAHHTLVSSIRRGQVAEAARQRIGLQAKIELEGDSLRRVERAVLGDAWVAEVLAGLPAEQREAVRARVLEERSYEDIAVELETSSLVVRKRVSRGLARLRSELEKRP